MERVILRWFRSKSDSKLPLLDIFAASGLITIFGTRAYLALMNYPQIGGETLHIAHMLWGGLLLVLVVLFLGLANQPDKRIAMLAGGIGFGLFIDELGKFITVDNNYFYRPAASIIIIVYIILWVSLRFIIARHENKPLLPAAEWPTRKFESVFVYAWLIIQTLIIVGLTIIAPFATDSLAIELSYYAIYILYVLYAIALLFAWTLILRQNKPRAAEVIRSIAALEILVLTPINFYISQFGAAVGFMLLVAIIVATSRNYDRT